MIDLQIGNSRRDEGYKYRINRREIDVQIRVGIQRKEKLFIIELISMLEPLENKGLPDRRKNKSPVKPTEIQGFRNGPMPKTLKCD